MKAKTLFLAWMLTLSWNNTMSEKSCLAKTKEELIEVLDSVKEDNTFVLNWKTYKIVWTPNSIQASFYSDKFHWRNTASGEKYNKNDYTAAHKTLPFWTEVLMIDTTTNDSVVVKVNDRWPYIKNRAFDLSKQAASKLGNMLKAGKKQLKSIIVEEIKEKTKKEEHKDRQDT